MSTFVPCSGSFSPMACAGTAVRMVGYYQLVKIFVLGCGIRVQASRGPVEIHSSQHSV